MATKQEKLETLKKQVGIDPDDILGQAESTEKEAEASGVAFKEGDGSGIFEEVEAEAQKAMKKKPAEGTAEEEAEETPEEEAGEVAAGEGDAEDLQKGKPKGKNKEADSEDEAEFKHEDGEEGADEAYVIGDMTPLEFSEYMGDLLAEYVPGILKEHVSAVADEKATKELDGARAQIAAFKEAETAWGKEKAALTAQIQQLTAENSRLKEYEADAPRAVRKNVGYVASQADETIKESFEGNGGGPQNDPVNQFVADFVLKNPQR